MLCIYNRKQMPAVKCLICNNKLGIGHTTHIQIIIDYNRESLMVIYV